MISCNRIHTRKTSEHACPSCCSPRVKDAILRTSHNSLVDGRGQEPRRRAVPAEEMKSQTRLRLDGPGCITARVGINRNALASPEVDETGKVEHLVASRCHVLHLAKQPNCFVGSDVIYDQTSLEETWEE